MYNKSNIMKNIWKIFRENKTTFSIALKRSWKKEKDKVYKNIYNIINKISRYYSIKYKIDYEDLLSFSNEILLKLIKKYKSNIGTFEGFLFKQLNFYILNFIKEEKLKRERDKIIEFSLPTIYENFYKEKLHISKLSEQIINYCLDQNTESEIVYQKVKYKNKVYNYALNLEKITQKNIKEYFRNLGYSLKDILNVITEIKFLLKGDLI